MLTYGSLSGAMKQRRTTAAGTSDIAMPETSGIGASHQEVCHAALTGPQQNTDTSPVAK